MTPKLNLQAGVYCRISSDPTGRAAGVERQQSECLELVSANGWTVHDVYTDNDISAFSGKHRPEYQRLLDDVRAGSVTAIVAWHPDRLTRRMADLVPFIELVKVANAQVATVQGGQYDLSTASGRMTAQIIGSVAEQESAHKSERLISKHMQLAKDGEDAGWGGWRPFGYEADRKTINPAEADLIREAARRVLDGDTLRGICMDWTKRGIAPVGTKLRADGTKREWNSQSLRKLLMSARISGRREHHKQITSDHATWPGIISVADSDSLRALFSDPKRRMNGRPREYLLTGGIARCGACGRPLIAQPKGKNRAMTCLKDRGGCGKITVVAEPLEAHITAAVLERVDAGALATAMGGHGQQEDRQAIERLLELDAKEVELGRDFAKQSHVFTMAALEAIAAERAPLQRRVDAMNVANGLDGLPAGNALRAAWPDLPNRKRQAVVSALIEAVVVGPAVPGRNFFDPERINPPKGKIVWKA